MEQEASLPAEGKYSTLRRMIGLLTANITSVPSFICTFGLHQQSQLSTFAQE
jgi:hypothetical protein